MNGYQHRELAAGRWSTLGFMEQMANIGSEVERAISWKNKHNGEYGRMAINRGLELLELTKADARNVTRLKELCRLYEALADYFTAERAQSAGMDFKIESKNRKGK